MDYKKTNAPVTSTTKDLDELGHNTDNVYQNIAIISKRANQIGVEIKTELNSKLEEFASYSDNLEEVFENREQIEISKFYERLPKPSSIAAQEFLEDNVYFRVPEAIEPNEE